MQPKGPICAIELAAPLRHLGPMPNSVALSLFALIATLFAADFLLLGWGLPVLVMEQLARLIQWMAFWR